MLLSEKNKVRVNEICKKFKMTSERFEKTYDYLRSQPYYSNVSEDSIIDFLEAQTKMLFYRAIEYLPGEKQDYENN